MNERPVASVLPTMSAEQADRLSALFEAHADRLYRLARRLVPSADDALDLVQEAFLKAARSPESIPRGLRDEEAWLVRVLINVRRDQWRKEAVRKRHQLDLSRPPVQHDAPERACRIRAAVGTGEDRPIPGWVVAQGAAAGRVICLEPGMLGNNDDIAQRWMLQDGPDRF